ncbi:MAG: Glyoxalase/bleomycin resistance protein/dioxygenase [Conexibacter sp.]|nr:Glyoxalase/bleomycin resistance protein/dioxygenase [Conexibacter sp.]
MTVQAGHQVVQSGGAAAGKLRGINHLALFTHDMEATVRFYRDVLGLKVVRTNGRVDTLKEVRTGDDDARENFTFERQYFFELANGELYSLYEVNDLDDRFDGSIVPHLWPGVPERVRSVTRPQKLDHLAFDVPSRDDLVWFQARLQSYGIAVSKIIERKLDPSHAKFVKSIYFYDPSGNSLEISTMDLGDPEWEGYDRSDWFRDDRPVPALFAPVEEPGA